jgi:hypothetical protein
VLSQEDLLKFQADHFFTSVSSIATVGNHDLHEKGHVGEQGEAYDGDAYYEEDDGLGYYADGVTRTLTDEQIKIFRHSEIHALLRERQRLREEQEEQEEQEDEAVDTTRAVAEPKSKTASDPNAVTTAANRKFTEQDQNPVANGSHKRARHDVDENQTNKKRSSPPTGSPFVRRIVSYADD